MIRKTLFITTATVISIFIIFFLITQTAIINAKGWHIIGLAFGHAKKYQLALKSFTKAIEQNPKFTNSYACRGELYAIIGNYKQAIQDFDKAIELGDQNTMTYNDRGRAYTIIGNYRQAMQDFNKAIELNPKYALAYAFRGIAYDKLGDSNQAFRDFNKAVELDPKDARFYVSRGLEYKYIGKYEQALKDYDKAIELNPKSTSPYVSRGSTFYSIGDYRHAVQDYTTAILLNPNYAKIYDMRGIAYYELGEHKQAIQDYEKAIELDSKYEYSYLRAIISSGYLSNEEHKIRLERLSRHVEENKSDAWIRSISMYYLGKITEEQLLAEAKKSGDTKETNERLCEAYYFIGEATLFKKDRRQALGFFTKAVKTGVVNFMEYNQAKAAIKKMENIR